MPRKRIAPDDVLRHHGKPVKGLTHVARLPAQKHLDRRGKTQNRFSNTATTVQSVCSFIPLLIRNGRLWKSRAAPGKLHPKHFTIFPGLPNLTH
jgi:hypothetical protein